MELKIESLIFLHILIVWAEDFHAICLPCQIHVVQQFVGGNAKFAHVRFLD